MDAAVTEPIEDSYQQKALVCPRIIELTNSGKTAHVPVKICNISAKVLRIPSRSEICQLNEVKVIRQADTFENIRTPEREDTSKTSEHGSPTSHQQPSSETEKLSNGDNNIKDDFGVDMEDSDLSTVQKQKVYNLFKKWESVFPKDEHDLGRTTAVRHKIELTDDNPFKEPYRSVPPAIYNEVREHLQEMLSIGAIKESKSPWSSNIVIVRKNTGKIRFCIDYRKLNARTKKDAYAIPRVDDTLHLLSGSRYYSKLEIY